MSYDVDIKNDDSLIEKINTVNETKFTISEYPKLQYDEKHKAFILSKEELDNWEW